MGTFVKNFFENNADLKDIDNYVDQWHESDSKLELWQYLGFNTAEDYALWALQPSELIHILNRYHRESFPN